MVCFLVGYLGEIAETGIDIELTTDLTDCTDMIIDKTILDELTAQAKANPRLRQSLD